MLWKIAFFIAVKVGMEVHTGCTALESQCSLSVHTPNTVTFSVLFGWDFHKYRLEIILTITAVMSAGQLLLISWTGSKCREFLKIP